MTQDVDVMIVYGQLGQYMYLASDAEQSKIPYRYGPFDEAVTFLRKKEINPKVAIIHLGMEIIDKDNTHGELIEEVSKLLPKFTRRILVCGGIKTPYEGMRAAIELGGDELFSYDGFSGKNAELEEIIKRGWATEAEIETRHQSIAIGGKREGQGIWPERKHSMRPWDYNDGYFKK